MNPKQLSQIINVDPKEIRSYARKRFNKTDKSWDFEEWQVTLIKDHFAHAGTKASSTMAAPLKEINITLRELTQIAKEFLLEAYGMELTIPIEINTRIRKRLGTFWYRKATSITPKKPLKIDIGEKLLENYPREVAIDVLKHELIHYACFMQNMPHNDGDYYFEDQLRKHGVGSTKTHKRRGEHHHYVCSNCGSQVGYTIRKRDKWITPQYHTKCCKARIKYNGKVSL